VAECDECGETTLHRVRGYISGAGGVQYGWTNLCVSCIHEITVDLCEGVTLRIQKQVPK
jgi:hypothetical protein